MGEASPEPLRVGFDRRPKLEFHDSEISSDGGSLPYRELDDALGLSVLAGEILSEVRRGKNTRHLPTGLLRQSVFGRLARYEDVNEAERLASDPVMRAIVDRKGLEGMATISAGTGGHMGNVGSIATQGPASARVPAGRELCYRLGAAMESVFGISRP
jgi:hypothetical protein